MSRIYSLFSNLLTKIIENYVAVFWDKLLLSSNYLCNKCRNYRHILNVNLCFLFVCFILDFYAKNVIDFSDVVKYYPIYLAFIYKCKLIKRYVKINYYKGFSNKSFVNTFFSNFIINQYLNNSIIEIFLHVILIQA